MATPPDQQNVPSRPDPAEPFDRPEAARGGAVPDWEGEILPSNREVPLAPEWEEEERTPAGGALWGWWVVATAIGWAAAGGLIAAAFGDSNSVWQYLFVPLSAVGQWLVLRRRFAHAGYWLLATAIGAAVAAVGYALLLAAPISMLGPVDSGVREGLSSVVDGLALSIAQWVVLRQTVRDAGWWVPAVAVPHVLLSLIAFSRGLASPEIPQELSAADLAANAAIFYALFGLFQGALSGAVLVRVVRRPRHAPHH
jgi:hypothetical protein